MILGFIFAVVVSILFAVYAVPRKYSRQHVILYTMWMGIAYFIGTMVVIVLMVGWGEREMEDLSSPWHMVTIARGFIWVLGMAAYNLAIDHIGLARFNQWKNIQGPVGSLLMLFLLAEIVGVKVLWLLLGMSAMLTSAFLFQIKMESMDKTDSLQGVAWAVFAGVCFGVSALLNKIVSDQGFLFAQLIYHSSSLILFSAIVYLFIGNIGKESFRQRLNNLVHLDRTIWLPFMSGGMFLIATVLTILAYDLIAGPVLWSITQLNAAWTILIGIFLFKEIDVRVHWIRISIGFFVTAAAVVFLFFAM